MKILHCMKGTLNAMLALAALTGYGSLAIGQNTATPAAGEERIVIVMADGTSFVHRLGGQRIKIRTATGESEVPLSDQYRT